MNQCVIIGGADIGDYAAAASFIRPLDYIICCDCGLRHRAPLGVEADLIIGDFDSHENPMAAIETIVLPHRKDDTDTMYAIKEALRRGFREFLLLGVCGNRMDHTLGNLYALLYLYHRGAHGVIVDDYSEMELVDSTPVSISDRYPYFSLLNITGTASGISIENAIFPLSDGSIEPEYQYGVSNEVIPGKTAVVSVSEGLLLLIKDRI